MVRRLQHDDKRADVKQLSALTGLSAERIKSLLKAGHINPPFILIGRRKLYHQTTALFEIEQWAGRPLVNAAEYVTIGALTEIVNKTYGTRHTANNIRNIIVRERLEANIETSKRGHIKIYNCMDAVVMLGRVIKIMNDRKAIRQLAKLIY